MLVLTLVFMSLARFSIAQQQYGSGILSNLFTFPKLCFCKCGLVRSNGGWFEPAAEPTTPGQFPWVVTVKIGDQYATGSLISDRHVITAASFLYNIPTGNISVTLGSRGRCDTDSGLTSSVESVTIHPEFTPIAMENDLALIRLRYIVPFGNNYSPICLPFAGIRNTGKVAYAVSYSNSTCLGRVVTLPVLSTQQCLTGAANVTYVTADKGCLGPIATRGLFCRNDVGSPVMTQWKTGTSFHLIGVVSSSDCGRITTPLYTRVVDHLAWIKSQTRSACSCYSKF